MRTSIRLLGVTAAAAAMLAMGSPAFADGGKGHHGKGGKDDHSVTASEAQGGKGEGGNGGLGVNVLCGIGVGVLGEGTGSCSAGNGGNGIGGDADSSAYSED
ncbi:hypothetical protein AB0I53_47490 [Saccharopolyspora sp. NPDC050389]|uniref:hypothetical protein n=1 Tax=Saccharopolyspora sp. NPDC050389 TaxID=3155516 RepID=UPI0033DB4598